MPLNLSHHVHTTSCLSSQEARRTAGAKYPGSDVIITPVSHRDWHVALPKYIPVNYTAPSVSGHPEGTDPGIVRFESISSSLCAFSK